MILEALLTLASSLAGGTDYAADAELVVRTYDLSSLATPTVGGDGYSLGLLPRIHWPEGDESGSGGERAFTVDVVGNIITEQLAEEFEYEGRSIWIGEDNQMIVRAPAGLQDKVGAYVRLLEEVVQDQSTLRVDVLSFNGGAQDLRAPAPDISGKDAEAFLGGTWEGLSAEAWAGSERDSYRVTLRSGQPARVAALQELRLLIDYDVEIAQGAGVHDPIHLPISLGFDLTLLPAAAPEGVHLALVLRDAGLIGERRDETNRQAILIGSEGTASGFRQGPSRFQSASITSHAVACNALLRPGRALVFEVSSRVEEELERTFVVLRLAGGALQGVYQHKLNGESLTLIDSGLLVPPSAAMGRSLRECLADDERLGNMQWENASTILRAQLATGETDTIHETLQLAGACSYLDTTGPWIVARPDQDLIQEARAEERRIPELGELVRELASSPEMVVVSLALRDGGQRRVVIDRCVLPVTVGSECVLVLGKEHTQLPDYDVEVAQFASVADTNSSVLFDGMLARLRTSRDSTGALILDLEVEASVVQDSRRLDLDSPYVQWLDQTDLGTLRLQERIIVPEGREHRELVLGDEAGDRGISLVVSVKR